MEGNAARDWAAEGEPGGKVLVFRDSRSPEEQSCSGGVPRWQQVHEALVELAQQQALSDYEQGWWLLEALRQGVHAKLGFGSHLEYGDRLFGYGPRAVAERLRVAHALEELPQTREALVMGQLHWSAVRELCRVVKPETEGQWVEACRGATARQVEKMVSGREPGDLPTDPAKERARRHRLRLEVSAEVMALFREAVGELTRRAGCSLGDDEVLEAMARAVLGGPVDEGRSSYQIALTVCESCGQGWQQGRGELIPVQPEVVEKARCDHQDIGRVDGGQGDGRAAEAASDTHVGAGGSADSEDDGVERWQVTHVGAHPRVGVDDDVERKQVTHMGTTAPGEDDELERMAPPHSGAHPAAGDDRGRERVTHVGAHDERRAERPSAAARRRASQSIPPAVRREALRRFGGKCAVPGCQHADWLDLHHLRYRTDSTTQVEDVIPACGSHHKAVHAGRLIIEGDTTAKPLRFLHADGREYGAAILPPAGERPRGGQELGGAMETAYDALCRLGFRKSEVRRVLRELSSSPGDTHVGHGAAGGVEDIVRWALAVLTG